MNEFNGIGPWHAMATTAMDRKLCCNCAARTKIWQNSGSTNNNVSRQTMKAFQMASVYWEIKGLGFHQLNLDAKIMARRAHHTKRESSISVCSTCLCLGRANTHTHLTFYRSFFLLFFLCGNRLWKKEEKYNVCLAYCRNRINITQTQQRCRFWCLIHLIFSLVPTNAIVQFMRLILPLLSYFFFSHSFDRRRRRRRRCRCCCHSHRHHHSHTKESTVLYFRRGIVHTLASHLRWSYALCIYTNTQIHSYFFP